MTPSVANVDSGGGRGCGAASRANGADLVENANLQQSM